MFASKKFLVISLVVSIWVFFIYASPLLADFSLYWQNQNYFLVESRFFNTLDLDKQGAPASNNAGNQRLFSTFKLRMKPSLSITDRLTLHAMFDAFMSPYTTKSQEEGALLGQPATDTNGYGPNTTNLPRQLFGDGSSSSGTFSQTSLTSGDGNFLLRAAYFEYIGDWGIFKVGRQPRHWGLGIRYNSGEKPWDKFGDRTDTLSYELGLGNFKVSALYTKIAENAIDSKKDDVTLYESYLHWNDPEKDFDLGFLYTFFRESRVFIAMHYLDAYFMKKAKQWQAGIEAVLGSGSPGTVSGNMAAQVGVASEFEYDWTASLSNFLKLGYASGPDIERTGRLTNFAFDRNYDIALLMFNQPLGAISGSTGIDANSDPDVNAIFSAYYLNIGGKYQFNDRIGTSLGWTTAQSPMALASGGDKDYGNEIDGSLWYRFLENLKFKADTGIFFPGKLYKGATLSRATNFAYGGELSATLIF